MSTLDIDSERHGTALRDAQIGDDVRIIIRGRVSKIEADMVDVSNYDKTDYLHSRVVTTIVVTSIEHAPQVTFDGITLGGSA